MKSAADHLASLLTGQTPLLNEHVPFSKEVRPFLKYVVLLLGIIALYSWLFGLVMTYEGQEHTTFTGVYWTLTVMTTLGFGDITFHTDLGKAFSILVMLTGVILLLIVMPFLFIRTVYTPWLEQRSRARVRMLRTVPDNVSGHVIIAVNDPVAVALIQRLRVAGIKAYVIEPDADKAIRMRDAGLPVICGEVDAGATYDAAGIGRATMVFANSNDTENSNIILTVRERAEQVPVVAIAESADSIDVLQLSGATHVLPLRRQLGEQLAKRVSAGTARANVIGRVHDMVLAEFPVRDTPLQGRRIEELQLREFIGVAVIGVWEHGTLHTPTPSMVLSPSSAPVVIGSQAQIDELNEMLIIYNVNPNPVLVLGGGHVGRTAARVLRKRGIPVNLVDKEPAVARRAATAADKVLVGDASDRQILTNAGVEAAPSILLTTHDDATNIFLTVYCRRLNPTARILTRVTYERNVEAIRRAGADFVLSYASLGVHSVLALVQARDRVVLGEGADLFQIPIPLTMVGRTLDEVNVPERTGLTVIALQNGNRVKQLPPGDSVLERDGYIFALGTPLDREHFRRAFG